MVGQTISHYHILEKLGEGGMGVVYKAEDTKLKRIVALKFLHPDLTRDEEAKLRFIREAQTASNLDHPNICTVHDVGDAGEGQSYIVMACYEGETLRKKLERDPLGIDEAMEIASEVASGLARAHEAGIVHRDIKPANIMLTARNGAKILDFGVAKLAVPATSTATGPTMGTAAYMSPEQARGERVDHRTDIWSLGAVLYELLTGQRAFRGDHEQGLVYSIVREEPAPVRQIRPEVPEVVEQIVQKSMAKNPADRYQTMDELLSDLNIARGKEDTGGTIAAAQHVATARKKKQRRMLIASGLTILVVAIGVLVVVPTIQDQALASHPRTIAVISFENLTDDKAQDHLRLVLQDAIITSLEQSKYIRVTTRQRMADLLKQLGKKDVDYVDNELGLEICRKEGAELMAVGTIARAGDFYRTTLKLVDVRTLETAASYAASGKGLESLLEKQVDELCRDISRGIGVSNLRTQETIRPISTISTTSVEAYQLYLRGLQENKRVYFSEGRRFLEMAVQKDSQFAMAWFHLGDACQWLSDSKAADAAFSKAISLAWKTSEKEQWNIAIADSSLRANLLGMPGLTDTEFKKLCAERFPREKEFLNLWGNALWVDLKRPKEAIPVLQRALELDPEYGPALNNLAYAYDATGDWVSAIGTLKRYAMASPGDANPWDSMGQIYAKNRKSKEAVECFRQALAVSSSWYFSAQGLVWLYFLQEDYKSAYQWVDSSDARARDTGNRALQMYMRAYIAFWQGELGKSENFLAKCRAAQGSRPLDYGVDFLTMWIALEKRQYARSRHALDEWVRQYVVKSEPGGRRLTEACAEVFRGLINIREGRMDLAAAHLAAVDSVGSRVQATDTSMMARRLRSFSSRPHGLLLKSEWLLASGRSQEALANRPVGGPARAASRPYFVAGAHALSYEVTCLAPLMVDVVPRAFLASGQLDSCIAAYERAVSCEADPNLPIFPRYHYRLAQVYEQKGLKAKAVSEYEKFLKLWGKADPIYKEPPDARMRLAKLKQQVSKGL